MTTKLTLTLSDKVIKFAKTYAKEHGTSLSKLVENYFSRISAHEINDPAFEKIPPITKELSGIISETPSESDKELLTKLNISPQPGSPRASASRRIRLRSGGSRVSSPASAFSFACRTFLAPTRGKVMPRWAAVQAITS